jgi:hypothetical protein
LGYAVAAAGQPQSRRQESKPAIAAGRSLASQSGAARSSSAGSGPRANLPYHEYLVMADRPWPLFGPDNTQGGLTPDWTYAYPAPIRVVSTGSNAGKRLHVAMDFTVPQAVLAEARTRIQAKTKAQVTLVPIPLRWYEITLRDPASGQEHTWREDPGGASGMILPPDRKVMTWDVPDELSVLRRLLAEHPRSVAVRVRAAYNFRTVASGVVRTGLVGSIDRAIDEVVHPAGEDREARELLLSREVRDEVQSRASQNTVHYLENAGLDADDWADAKAELARLVASSYERLHIVNLGDMLDATDGKFVYRYDSGQVEARPILTRNKVLQSQHEAAYNKKARDIIKTVQEVARDNKDARKFYTDIKQRLKGDLETSADVMGFFKGTGNLRLDKDEHSLNSSDVEQIAKSRDFYLSDRNWEEDISTYAKSKVEGELIDERTWAKTIDVVRFDRRELAQRVGALGEFVKTLGFEEVVLQDEVPLEVVADRGRSYESLEQGLKDAEAGLASARAEAHALHVRRSEDSKKAEAIQARRLELKKRMGDLEAEYSRLVDNSVELGGSIEALFDRIIAACTAREVIDVIAGPKSWEGMLGVYDHHRKVGWVIADLDGFENWVKGQLAIAVERAKIATERRDEAIAASRDSLRGTLRATAANASRIDEVRKAIAAGRVELQGLDTQLIKLFD